jgi:hypothetical protein
VAKMQAHIFYINRRKKQQQFLGKNLILTGEKTTAVSR